MLTGPSLDSPQLTGLPRGTFRQEPDTQTRATWTGHLHWPPRQIARSLRAQEGVAHFSLPIGGLRKVDSVIFSKKLVQSDGMETSVPRALFWMQLRTEFGGASAGVTLCRGGSGRLRREPLAAAPGDREPRPGREQEKGLRLGQREVFYITCVC